VKRRLWTGLLQGGLLVTQPRLVVPRWLGACTRSDTGRSRRRRAWRRRCIRSRAPQGSPHWSASASCPARCGSGPADRYPRQACRERLPSRRGIVPCRQAPSTATSIRYLTRVIVGSWASRVRWWYQRARACWRRRQFDQYSVWPGGPGRVVSRRAISGTVSGIIPGSAGARSSGLAGGGAWVSVRSRSRAGRVRSRTGCRGRLVFWLTDQSAAGPALPARMWLTSGLPCRRLPCPPRQRRPVRTCRTFWCVGGCVGGRVW